MKIFNISIKRNITSAIAWSLVLGIIFALVMLLFKIIGNMSGSVTSSLESLPLLVREIMGLQTMPNFAESLSYFAYFFQFVVLIASIYGGIVGARTLAPEEGKGTIEFLYSLPVSRASIATQKLLSAIVGYFIFTVILSAIAAAATFYIDKSLGLVTTILNLSPAFFALFFCGLIFLAIGFMFSALLRSGGESIPITLAIVVITYILGLMGSIVGQVSFLRFVSPIHNSIPLVYIETGISFLFVIVGLAIIVAAIVVAQLIYKRKNFMY